jgi:hypothetical protein
MKYLPIAVLLFFVSILGDTADAQTSSSKRTKSDVAVTLEGKGKPQTNTSGGKRPLYLCGSQDAITPLVPQSNISRTIAARPTLFVSLPQPSVRTVTMRLESESGEILYFGQMAIDRIAPQIARVKLPETAPALETGKRYKWSSAFTCGARLDPNDPIFSGWIERVSSPAALSQQQAKPSLALVAAYEANGLWLDALTALVAVDQSLNKSAPSSQLQEQVVTKWRSLLQAEGLSGLISNAIAR